MTGRAELVRIGLLLAALAATGLLALASLALGARSIPLADVIGALTAFGDSQAHRVVTMLRLPRTVLALAIGAALGVAGALMQGLTRNPLADPGLLGVNAGAALAVAIAISVFGLSEFGDHVWFACAGASLGAALVYGLGAAGGRAAPDRLILAGVAIGAIMSGATALLTLLKPAAFDMFRQWSVGGLGSASMTVFAASLPFLLAGGLTGLLIGRNLDAIALGEESATALGANPIRTRLLGVAAITLLCGAATAAAGPIGFVGLVTPHVARMAAGTSQRWIMAFSPLFGAQLLLFADIVGRLVMQPGELQAGFVTAFVGAPVLIALARGRKQGRAR